MEQYYWAGFRSFGRGKSEEACKGLREAHYPVRVRCNWYSGTMTASGNEHGEERPAF